MTTIRLDQLKQDPQNARHHSDRNLEVIRNSIREVGAARSIVIDEHDRILAGNGTVVGASQAGIQNVRVVDADGDELIAVRRSNLTDDQKILLALFDNRSAELAKWNIEMLEPILDMIDLETRHKVGFSNEDLVDLLDRVPSVEFKQFDESVADDVKFNECPECHHRWPA